MNDGSEISPRNTDIRKHRRISFDLPPSTFFTFGRREEFTFWQRSIGQKVDLDLRVIVIALPLPWSANEVVLRVEIVGERWNTPRALSEMSRGVHKIVMLLNIEYSRWLLLQCLALSAPSA